jgi:hypothetical protein
MKKILLILVLLACSVFAGKPVNVEVCRPGFCYTHVLHDVKKAEYRTDVAGLIALTAQRKEELESLENLDADLEELARKAQKHQAEM